MKKPNTAKTVSGATGSSVKEYTPATMNTTKEKTLTSSKYNSNIETNVLIQKQGEGLLFEL